MAELQKDPMTRGQFLWLGTLSTLVGAALTIPPVVYVLSPAIKAVLQGETDVPEEWVLLGSVFEVPAGEPAIHRVEFRQRQTYDARNVEGTITNAVLVSWRDGKLPDVLKTREEGERLSEAEIMELGRRINVLSNHCAHLGCPVRWLQEDAEIVCPCHGGVYTINGEVTAGPPPRDLYRYVFDIREDGSIYVKHRFDETPYVV